MSTQQSALSNQQGQAGNVVTGRPAMLSAECGVLSAVTGQ
jgi:hypothetical protein